LNKTIAILSSISFVILLFIGSPIYVAGFGPGSNPSLSSHSQSLNLQMAGEITNIDSQHWTMSGGPVIAAYIGGVSIDANSGQLSYSLDSHIHGNIIDGQAQVDLNATVGGVPIQVTGHLVINNMNGALCFPLPANPAMDCDTPDYIQPSYLNNASTVTSSGYTSAIPFVFEGDSSFTISGMSSQPISTTSGFAIEAPGDNLFGGPILISSGDQAVVIVANYTQASVRFHGVEMAGQLSGTVGSKTVLGQFTERLNINENFMTGVQHEHGSVNFQTNLSYLNGHGRLTGTTLSSYSNYISPLPVQPLLSGGSSQTADCSWATHVEGTCQLAQLTSAGSITMHGGHFNIESTFDSVWSIPSAAFMGQITGTVTSHHDHR
jgi:hypothetical protein